MNIRNAKFKVLMEIEKVLGRSIKSVTEKKDQTMTDLRDLAFITKYCEDQTYTLEKATDECSIADIAPESEETK